MDDAAGRLQQQHAGKVVNKPLLFGPAGGVFKLELFLPEDYPMAPPKVGGVNSAVHVGRIKFMAMCSNP